MSDAVNLLAPTPKSATQTGERFVIPAGGLEIVDRTDGSAALDRLIRELGRQDLECKGIVTHPRIATGRDQVRMVLEPDQDRPQGYRLEISGDAINLSAGDEAGLHHGVATLAQWCSLYLRQDAVTTLPGLRVVDWPDLVHRGVMLDVSRNKVPTLQTLFDLAERLAGWKINHLQLYMEHTFAYAGHESVWRHASPLTADDLQRLDRHCHRLGIELVPNQNSFGHMHRWLIHDRYRALAECPEGIEHPFSPKPEPFSLCPLDPGSLELLGDLYDQLLPNFRSRLFNVGLDETLDLGKGRSAEACRQRSNAAVYLDFVRNVHRLVTARRHRMMFWGDIVHNHPETIPELPADVIVLEWGYEADHPFASRLQEFADAGLEFYACPGTSSWNSIAGRTDNTLGNLAGAAQSAVSTGAAGVLITDWGDFGHLQPLPVSYLGMLSGACLAWNAEPAANPVGPPTATRLDRHVFDDAADVLGRTFYDLGNAYLYTGARPRNGSALFYLLLFAGETLEHSRFRGLDIKALEVTAQRLSDAVSDLGTARSVRADAALITSEARWCHDLLQLACRLGIERLRVGADKPLTDVAPQVRQNMARQMAGIEDQLRENWLARNRPGGLEDSVMYLARVREVLGR